MEGATFCETQNKGGLSLVMRHKIAGIVSSEEGEAQNEEAASD